MVGLGVAGGGVEAGEEAEGIEEEKILTEATTRGRREQARRCLGFDLLKQNH